MVIGMFTFRIWLSLVLGLGLMLGFGLGFGIGSLLGLCCWLDFG